MTKNQNAFETTLTAQFGPSDLVASASTLGTLTSPCYVVFEPDSDTQREVVYFDGVFGANSFVTTTITNRYLAGSAAVSGLTHPAGSTVRSVILAQHLEDIDDAISTLDHSDLAGLTSGDDHTQYLTKVDHSGTGFHDSLDINAGSLQGSEPSDFAPDSHVASSSTTAGHPLATTGSAGFMSASDKANLDSVVSSPGGVQSIVAGNDIDVSGTSVVTVSHEDTSSASSINNGPAEHIDALTIDGNGHVTAITKQTMSASDIGAASTSDLNTHKTSGDHDGRYYTEAEVNSLLGFKLNVSNPDATGQYRISGTAVVERQGIYTALKSGTNTVLFGDGTGLLQLGGVAYSAAPLAFDVQCIEDGVMREIYYTPVASSERYKQDIHLSPFTGGECLKWTIDEFRYIGDVEQLGDEAKVRHWVIAEKILEASGEAYIQRDNDGLVVNTDDRAMIADLILTVQQLEDRITQLENA